MNCASRMASQARHRPLHLLTPYKTTITRRHCVVCINSARPSRKQSNEAPISSKSAIQERTSIVPNRTYGIVSHSQVPKMRDGILTPAKLSPSLPSPVLSGNELAMVQHRNFLNLFGSSQQTEWSKAILEAEKLVGYSTSFMSLRCLLSDELANVAMHMKKLVGTKHPLLKTAKNFLTDGKHTLQTRGLIILLMARAANVTTHQAPTDTKSTAQSGGIYPSQRALAEISEMIHTAFLVHRGVVNLFNLDPSLGPVKVMEMGNKMAVLSGDFLLASACKALAGLRNTLVLELVSKAIAHLTEASFMSLCDGDSTSARALQPDVTFSDWERYVYLSSGTLIGHSCRGALELANHSSVMTESAYDFGKNFAWAQQMHTELQPFVSSGQGNLSLTSAPVILYLDAGHNQGQRSLPEYSDIRKLVRTIRSSSVLDTAKHLCHTYTDAALQALSVFPPSDSRTALKRMVNAVRI